MVSLSSLTNVWSTSTFSSNHDFILPSTILSMMFAGLLTFFGSFAIWSLVDLGFLGDHIGGDASRRVAIGVGATAVMCMAISRSTCALPFHPGPATKRRRFRRDGCIRRVPRRV